MAEVAKKKKKGRGPLPCMPMTALYGHTAAFGLDVRRWSVGLDSGCVRHLSPRFGRRTSQQMLMRCGAAGLWQDADRACHRWALAGHAAAQTPKWAGRAGCV